MDQETENLTTEAVSNRFPILIKEDLIFSLEYGDKYCVLHTDKVGPMTPTLFKFMKLYIKNLTFFVYNMGYKHLYTAAYEEDKVAQKLAERCGFTYFSSSEGFILYRQEIT